MAEDSDSLGAILVFLFVIAIFLVAIAALMPSVTPFPG